MSTCWTTHGARVGAGSRSWPQPGQEWGRGSVEPPLVASGGKATGSCLGWPGWPPMLRFSWPSGGGGLGGLTMSEDGGLEEVEESFRAAASCWASWATTCLRAASSASRASTRAWSRRQLVQEVGSVTLMAIDHTHSIGVEPQW